MSFTPLGLPSSILNALYKHEFKTPYPIQKEVIPHVLRGSDVLGIAKTGSGKTASYVLPILAQLQKTEISKNRHIDVLVVVPTRELAIQVESVFSMFSSELPESIKSLAVYGGVSINPQMIALQNVRVLVATPGRLLELVESKALSLQKTKTLVLDEADKILNLGFSEEMSRIFKLLPEKRQNLLFSATLSKDISNIKQVVLKTPVIVNIEEEKEVFDQIKQLAYLVSEGKKGPFLRYIIKKDNLKQVLVFVSSGHRADAVAKKLMTNGIQAASIHGKQSQGAREKVLRQFKLGIIRVLVTTDLLSRGIDIEVLPYVINYELPRSPKDYIHRIGRTGRAEALGQAISLVSPEEEHHFKVIQKKMGKWVDLIDSNNLTITN